MGEVRATRRSCLGLPNGRRPVGRSRQRWSDEVQNNLYDLSARDWQEHIQNRGAWQNPVSEAQSHFGSQRFRSKLIVKMKQQLLPQIPHNTKVKTSTNLITGISVCSNNKYIKCCECSRLKKQDHYQ